MIWSSRKGSNEPVLAQDEADLLLVVVDGSVPLTSDDRNLLNAVKDRKHVVVLNKTDLPDEVESDTALVDHASCRISAKTGLGIETVKSAASRPADVRGVLRQRRASPSQTCDTVMHCVGLANPWAKHLNPCSAGWQGSLSRSMCVPQPTPSVK